MTKKILKNIAYMIAILTIGFAVFQILIGNVTMGIYDNWPFKIVLVVSYIFWLSLAWRLFTEQRINAASKILINVLSALSSGALILLIYGTFQDISNTSCFLLTVKTSCVEYWSFSLVTSLLHPVIVVPILVMSAILAAKELIIMKRNDNASKR